MKVLMIEHFMPGNLYTKELCTQLCKKADVTVLTRKGYKDDGKVDWIVKPRLCYSSPPNKFLSLICIFIGWMHILKELCFGKYDIVHVQTFKVDSVEMFIYKLFAKDRLVHTAHNILPHEASAKDKKKYGRFYSNCNLIIVHNEYSKSLIVNEYGFSDRISVIPHGIYESQKKDINNNSFAAISEKIELLQLGMIRKYKGVDVLLKAVSLLEETEKDRIHITIAGKQYKALDETDYEKMIKTYGLESVVSFSPERVEDKEMDQLFKKADACVFPYRVVYGSGALLMAYTYRKPVIVSDIPALAEETDYGKAGLLFEKENPRELANAIIKFAHMTQVERDMYSENIGILVETKYNWSISAEKTFNAYIEMLNDGLGK